MKNLTALDALTAHAIDYAGLFPPAGLAMSPAVKNFADYINGPHRRMLGRFVVPTARLAEFVSAVNELDSSQLSSERWPISALVPPVAPNQNSSELIAAMAAIRDFNERHADHDARKMIIDCVEIKSNNPTDIATIATLIPSTLIAYVEIDAALDPSESLRQISLYPNRLRAKLRSGSLIADQIPSVAEVTRFIYAATNFGVPFKATAGLHHPLRGQYRLTYEPDSATGWMHGYFNVFAASVFANEHSLPLEKIAAMLSEESLSNFSITDSQLKWLDLSVSMSEITRSRETGIASFGSCSFTEPTEELSVLMNTMV